MRTEILKELCNLAGVSGFESQVREHLIRTWDTYLDDYTEDGMGNLIGLVKSGVSPAPNQL